MTLNEKSAAKTTCLFNLLDLLKFLLLAVMLVCTLVDSRELLRFFFQRGIYPKTRKNRSNLKDETSRWSKMK